MLWAALFLCLLIAAAVCDWKTRRLPNRVSAAVALCALPDLGADHLLGLALALPFLGLSMFFGDRPGFGGGDVKFLAAVFLVIGYGYSIAGMFFSALLLVLYAAGDWLLCRIRKHPRHRDVPLVPFFAVGFAAAYFMKIGGGLL